MSYHGNKVSASTAYRGAVYMVLAVIGTVVVISIVMVGSLPLLIESSSQGI